MLKFKAGGREIRFGRLFIVFGLVSLVGTLMATGVSAKPLRNVKTESLKFSPMKKAAFLNFPPLPKEIQDKIIGTAGNKPGAPLATKPDPNLSKEWALTNIDFFKVFTPLIQPIRPNIEQCSPGIVVAVVDTGIDYAHPELRDNVWINRGESGTWQPPKGQENLTACRDKSCNGIDDDNNGYADDVVGWDFVNEVPLPYDVHGHGTHISGIIASRPANGVGMVGVCPKVSIMALKYYDNSGVGYNNLQNTVRAIQYAIRNGADIINYSGGGADPAPSEQLAIEQARQKGILFVAAAGNDGHNNDQIPYYPASYGTDNIIAVASISRDNQLLPSSNYGAKRVQVAAPGLSILSSLPSGKFGPMSGTSQATAFVTGAAALLASQWKDKSDFDYRKLKQWIVEGTRPLPRKDSKKWLSGGIISVAKSIEIQKEELGSKKSAPRNDIALRPEKSLRPKTE